MTVNDALSRGQRLAAQAAEAAEVRDWQTHPDVVALRVERVRALGDRLIWAGVAVMLVFTIITVQAFVAGDAPVGSLEWVGAWFLEPGVILGLVGLLIWEGVTTHWRVPTGRWVRTAKWGLLAATYGMNTWGAWASSDWRGVLAHSVPPLAVFVLTEARTEMLDKLEECVHRAHAYATDRVDQREVKERRLQAERDARDARLAEQEQQRQADHEASLARIAAQRAESIAAIQRATRPVPPAEVKPVRTGRQRPGSAQAVRSDRSRKTARTAGGGTGPDVTDLLPAGRTVADRLAAEGRSLTRTALLAGLRADEVTCSTDRAGALLELLRSATVDEPDRPILTVARGA